MESNLFDRHVWRFRARVFAMATTLMALGGCVVCPDGSSGSACYMPAQGQYGGGYYPVAPAQYGSIYYPQGPSSYGAAYSQPVQAPYPGTYPGPIPGRFNQNYYAPVQSRHAPMPMYSPSTNNGAGYDARPGHEPGVGLSYPLSSNASNIGPSDTRSAIAPTLPEPGVGSGAASREFLIVARGAILAGRTGQAQEAMERAQTRLLDRSTPAFQTDRPSADPAVARISEALHALGAGDRVSAVQILDATIPMIN
jgi:hypothetical protein